MKDIFNKDFLKQACKIIVSRGTSFSFKFGLKEQEPNEGDYAVFTVRQYPDPDSEIKLEHTINWDEFGETVNIPKDKTNFEAGEYVYDFMLYEKQPDETFKKIPLCLPSVFIIMESVG